MKHAVRVILVAAFINYVALLAWVHLFHDRRSVYRSISVGDKLSIIDPRLDYQSDCFSTTTDKHSAVCQFSDFWHGYTISIENGVVTEKRYKHLEDPFHPKSLLPGSYLKWFVLLFCLVLIAGIGGSIWFVCRVPPRAMEGA
jgi:hypothetical protein